MNKQSIRTRFHWLFAAFLASALGMAPTTVLGAAFTVNALTDTRPTLGGAGSGTTGDLRYCITQSNYLAATSTIASTVSGTITLAGHELVIANNLSITGPASGSLIVDASHSSRVLYVAPGYTVSVSGISMINGNGVGNDPTSLDSGTLDNSGGCVCNDGAALTISNATISGGAPAQSYVNTKGGGIYSNADGTNASLTLNSCSITGNVSNYGGGGIYNYSYNATASLTVNSSAISSNTTGQITYTGGGGIENTGSAAVALLNNSAISNNTAGEGGGLYNMGLGGSSSLVATMTLTNCTISGNSATGGNGGGILNINFSSGIPAALTANRCVIRGNSSSLAGGGLANTNNDGDANATLLNTTLSGNTAGTSGGGIANLGITGNLQLTVFNCTLCGNSATTRGGGIDNDSKGSFSSVAATNLTCTGSTLAGNSALSGGAGISNDGKSSGLRPVVILGDTILALHPTGADYGSANGTGVSGGYNLVDDLTCTAFLTAAGDLNNTFAGLQVDADGAPVLQANGGPTPTVALLPTSLAIDAGKVEVDPSTGQPATTDQRGFLRPVDLSGVANAAGGDGSDIGATESGSTSVLQAIDVEQPLGSALVSGAGTTYFGSVNLGATSSVTFTIFNRGLADLHNLALRIDGTNAAEFQAGAVGATTLSYNASTAFTVTFTPAAYGTHTATVHVTSDDPVIPSFDIALSGNTPPPQPVIDVQEPAGISLVSGTSAVDLGLVSFGASSQRTFTVVNAGSASLTGIALSVTGANASEFKTASLGSTLLAAAASTTFTVTFAPTTYGTHAAVLHVASNDPATPSFNISLTGTDPGPQPLISVQQPAGTALVSGSSTVAFGTVSPGAANTLSFTVRNSGAASLINLALSVSGANAGEFKAGAPGSTTVTPGAATTFSVTFSPAAFGTHTAILHVTSNDPATPSFDLNLTGRDPGPQPSISVQQPAGVSLTSGGAVDFGPVAVGSSASRTFTIANNGQANLTGLGLSVSGSRASEFQLGTLNSATVAPGASTTFTVSFAPSVAGAHAATLQLNSNDPANSLFTVNLTGSDPGPQPSIAVREASGVALVAGSGTITFLPATVSGKNRQTVTILNGGAATLTFGAFTISGADAGDFQIGAPGAASLTPGGLTTFTITFSPSGNTIRTAVLHVLSNDPVSPSFDINLTGAGLTPFGNVAGIFSGALTSDGGSIVLNVLSNRTFTGKLILGGIAYPLQGKFNATGAFKGSPGFPGGQVNLQLALSDGNSAANKGEFHLTGTAGGSTLSAYHTVYAAGHPASEVGKYTVLLNPPAGADASIPQGTSYGTLVVSKAGGVIMAGKLADGTAFSMAGPIVGDSSGHHDFVFDKTGLYGGKGVLAGAVSFEALTASDCAGSVRWLKPRKNRGNYYRAGFETDLALAGARYFKPVGGAPFAAGLSSAVAQVSGGGLSAPIEEAASLSALNTVSIAGVNSERLTFAINAKAGTFTGSFAYPGSGKVTKFAGVLYAHANAPQADGFFLGPIADGAGESGSVSLKAP